MREGGLRVYTTINPGLQRAATAAISHVLTEPTDPAAALVSIDPRNGAIKAMTAITPGRHGNQFNFVTSARRQPGSTFKTIALTTAVSRGMDPFRTSYLSAPFHYQPDSTCNPNDPNCAWNVQTYAHDYHGVESVASATVQSDNTVYARLSLDVGPENIVAMARKLGIRTSPLQAVPSLALGTIGVTPLEMASAYATLAAGGVYSKPMAITKVVLPNGKTDTSASWGKPQRERVIPDWVASTVTQVLEQNMLYGTGTGAHVANHTDAGKSGTTDNYADAWFNGYTPRLQVGCLDRLPVGRDPDAERARDRGLRPDLPRADLASLYGDGDRQPARRCVPAGEDDAAVDVVAGSVRVQRLLRRVRHGDHVVDAARDDRVAHDEPCAYDDGCVGAAPADDDVRPAAAALDGADAAPSLRRRPSAPPRSSRAAYGVVVTVSAAVVVGGGAVVVGGGAVVVGGGGVVVAASSLAAVRPSSSEEAALYARWLFERSSSARSSFAACSSTVPSLSSRLTSSASSSSTRS